MLIWHAFRFSADMNSAGDHGPFRASRFFDVAQIYDRKGAIVPTTRRSDDVIRRLCWPLVQFFGTYRSHPE